MIRRASNWLNRHPILSMLAGWLLVVTVVLTFIPAAPASVDAVVQHGRST